MKKINISKKYSIVPSKHMFIEGNEQKMPHYCDSMAIIFHVSPEKKRFRFIARKNASYLNANGEAKHIKKLCQKKDSLSMR